MKKNFKILLKSLLVLLIIVIFLISVAMSSVLDVINVEGVKEYEKESGLNVSEGMPYLRFIEIAYQNENTFTSIINYTGIVVVLVILSLIFKEIFKIIRKFFKIQDKESRIVTEESSDK